MQKEDPDYIIKVEKAIAEKYGEETIQNPRASWSAEKEQSYLDQIKKLASKQERIDDKSEKIMVNGFLIEKKLINNKKSERRCPICEEYSFVGQDDLYMAKYECCHKCFAQHVEDREERWKTGWRPKGVKK